MSVSLAERTQILSFQMIAMEALRLLAKGLDCKRTFHDGLPLDFGRVVSVTAIINHGDFNSSIDHFSERFLQPLMRDLAAKISPLGGKLVFGKLDILNGYSASELVIDVFGGVAMRMFYAYDINTDRFMLRADVLCAAIKGAEQNAS